MTAAAVAHVRNDSAERRLGGGKLVWEQSRKQTCPPNLAVRWARKWGMGVRQSLFPMLTFGALPCGRLPASRRYSPRQAEFSGLVAGPFRALPPLNFRVRLFSSLRLMVAPPACEPGQDTSMISSASWPLSSGTATAFGRAFTLCHGSRLFTLRLYFAHRPAVSFSTSPTFRKVFPRPAKTLSPSRFKCSLCPAFRRLSLSGSSLKKTARVIRIVLVHSNNRLPFG